MLNNQLINGLPIEILLKIIQKTKYVNFDRIFKNTEIIINNIEAYQKQIVILENQCKSMYKVLKKIENYFSTIMPFYNLISIYCVYKIFYPFIKLIFLLINKHIYEMLKYLIVLLPSIIYNLNLLN